MKVPEQNKSVVRFEISPRTIALILVTIAVVWLAYQPWIVELMLVMALILAGTFNPLIEWMEKHGFRRVYALILLFFALIVVASVLLFLTIPPLVEQLMQMVQDAPAARTRLIAFLSERSFTRPIADAVQSVGLEQTFAGIKRRSAPRSRCCWPPAAWPWSSGPAIRIPWSCRGRRKGSNERSAAGDKREAMGGEFRSRGAGRKSYSKYQVPPSRSAQRMTTSVSVIVTGR